jgi:hypothetical protein
MLKFSADFVTFREQVAEYPELGLSLWIDRSKRTVSRILM